MVPNCGVPQTCPYARLEMEGAGEVLLLSRSSQLEPRAV